MGVSSYAAKRMDKILAKNQVINSGSPISEFLIVPPHLLSKM